MARSWYVNGETMVYVKGPSGSSIGSLSELGLSDTDIRCTPDYKHEPVMVDAWGQAPADLQFMLAAVNIQMTLVHFDYAVLKECLRLSGGGSAAEGTMPHAGTLLGNSLSRFAAGCNFIGLNLAAPIGNQPWRFYATYLVGQPITFPLGTKKSIVTLNWQAIPYFPDPWNSGSGANGIPLWDHTLDT